jgi:multidrug efflux system membrane fusion protein
VATADANTAAAKAGVTSATSGLSAARSGIEAATAAVAAAEKEIERLTITAPFSGLLESDTAELGSLLQPGALCATIIQLDQIKLVGFVPETEVNRVTLGAQAGARLAAGGREVIGKVIFLSRAADPETRTFRVEIAVPNTDLTIRDGQTAEIAIASAGVKAHLVPQSALTLNDDGTLGVRLVDADAVVAFAPVEIMRDAIDGVWVTGLPAVADVIVVGQEYVTAGVKVAPTWDEVTQ